MKGEIKYKSTLFGIISSLNKYLNLKYALICKNNILKNNIKSIKNS